MSKEKPIREWVDPLPESLDISFELYPFITELTFLVEFKNYSDKEEYKLVKRNNYAYQDGNDFWVVSYLGEYLANINGELMWVNRLDCPKSDAAVQKFFNAVSYETAEDAFQALKEYDFAKGFPFYSFTEKRVILNKHPESGNK